MPGAIDPAVQHALASSLAGRGCAVLLTGPPGRGMSRRLLEAADLARARGMHVAYAGGRAAECSLAFSVAVELFEPLWLQVAEPGLRAELSAGPAAAAARLLDGSDPPGPDDSARRFAITRGMWAIARRLARHPSPAGPGPPRGLAIVVDDLHDVDDPSAGWLAYAAGRLGSAPVAILAGRRIDIEPGAPAALAAITRAARVVELPLLGPEAGAALVRSRLPVASPRFVGACLAASGGDGALLRALVVGLAARGWSGSDAEAPHVGAVMPREVLTLAAERLARTPEPARALLRAAAASDQPLAVERAAAQAGLPPGVALQAVDALVSAGVLVPELPLAFSQPSFRLAVRTLLTPGHRARHSPSGELATGADSERLLTLTRSERRVAELAERGMTTNQMASTLFVTPKTIEFHLTNLYRKLGIPSSRTALVGALRARDPALLREASP